MPSLILASSSLGRRKLLDAIKIRYHILPSNIDEDKIHGKSPVATIRLRAKLKGEKVAEDIVKGAKIISLPYPLVILSADSDAILDGKVTGKAANIEEGLKIHKRLAGRTHLFATSVFIFKIDNNKSKAKKLIYSGETKSKVTFRKMSEDEIGLYLERTDFTRYAGSYALGGAQFFVTKVEGSLSNVIGLPLEAVIPIFRKLGL